MYESGYLNRVAVLLFTNHPEEKIGGAVVKIAYFQNDADILFQDEVWGDLLTQSDKTHDLLMSKYTRGMIHYEGVCDLTAEAILSERKPGSGSSGGSGMSGGGWIWTRMREAGRIFSQ